MSNCFNNTDSYFAAANGYEGFRSNFEPLLSSQNVKKLFILKGGPGTGKSTLMRKIAGEFESEANVTRIFCSSDTSSLDGVLMENDGICVGIVDGTSPHVVEAKHPGAVEEIVNLGDGFNYQELRARAEDIFELSKLKQCAYKRAYSALRAAGKVKAYIDDVFVDFGIYKKAEHVSNGFTDKIDIPKGRIEDSGFLISAFSKNGHTYLPYNITDKRLVSICGDGISEYFIMKMISQKLSKCGCAAKLYSAPFSQDMIDLIETDNVVYKVSNGENTISDICISLSEAPGYTKIKKAYDSLLSVAQNEFTLASSYHFKLEDIYSRNISFEANESKKTRIIEEIKEVFCK